MTGLLEKIPSGSQVELAEIEAKSRTVAVAEGRTKHQQGAFSRSVSVRVLKSGGQGLVTSTKTGPSEIKALIQKAVEIADHSPKDPHHRLAAAEQSYPPSLPVDDKLFEKSLPDHVDSLHRLEKLILSFDSRIKKVVRLDLRESRQKTVLSNSQGLQVESEGSSTTFLGEVASADGNQLEVAWDYRSARFSEDLDLETISGELAQQAVRSLGGKALPSGSYPVLVHPRVGCQLLNLIGAALSAEAVQTGRSFFKDKLNAPAAASIVHLIDDPLLPSGVTSSHMDDEGSPTQTMTIIENGILKDFFFDLKTSSKANRETNGHGIKTSLGALPRPHPTNFYLKPGKSTEQELLASHPRVFYLGDVMGLHMADPITGEFSLGASGFLYENGRQSHAVRGVTIAGRLLDVLGNIVDLGNKLTWYGDRGSPLFLVSKLTIAGA